jgi:Holliday junction resolvasome RuvABC endonuclease subunit
MILALDLGTTTGWATRERCYIASGTITFKPSRYEGGGMRYLRFRRWLDEFLNLEPIEAVLFEEVRRHAATDAAHVYGGFLATLSAWCEEARAPYVGIPVGTIKRAATGKGNASKAEMIAAVRVHGYAPHDDNEADAIAIALHFDADGSERAP